MSELTVVKHDLRGAFDLTLPPAGARGTNTEGDVLTQTADGRPLNDMWRDFIRSLGIWNSKRSALVNLLTFGVTEPIEMVPNYVGDDFQEASEFGEPVGLRGGDYSQFGYDFKWYDLAIRYTWKFLAEATAEQIEGLNNQAFEADNRLVFNKTLKAIFNNVNRTADINQLAINVYPFYNNDGTVPPTYKNTTFLGTHNHYITTGAAILDFGDLDDMENHLKHHGYGKEQGSTLVLLVNSQEAAKIRTFRVTGGATYDFLPSTSQPGFLVVGAGIDPGRPASSFQGLPVTGTYGPWIVIEEDYVPATYMVGFATGGENSASNPVGIREHRNAGLRGLRLVKGRDNDYPLIDSFYNRGFGTGVRVRGAGIVSQVTASGTYAIPAAYQ